MLSCVLNSSRFSLLIKKLGSSAIKWRLGALVFIYILIHLVGGGPGIDSLGLRFNTCFPTEILARSLNIAGSFGRRLPNMAERYTIFGRGSGG
jgi:hypothetical protein